VFWFVHCFLVGDLSWPLLFRWMLTSYLWCTLFLKWEVSTNFPSKLAHKPTAVIISDVSPNLHISYFSLIFTQEIHLRRDNIFFSQLASGRAEWCPFIPFQAIGNLFLLSCELFLLSSMWIQVAELCLMSQMSVRAALSSVFILEGKKNE